MAPLKIKRLDGWQSEFSIEGKLLCHKSTSWQGALREYWPIEWATTNVFRRPSNMTAPRGLLLLLLLGAVIVFMLSIFAFINSSPGPIWKAPADNLVSIGVLCAALGVTSWGLVRLGGQWMGGWKVCAVIIHPPFSGMIGYELPAPKSDDDVVNLLAEQIAWHRSQPTELTYNDAITPFHVYQPSFLAILQFRLIYSALMSILMLLVAAVFVNVSNAEDSGLWSLSQTRYGLYFIVILLPFLPHLKSVAMTHFEQKKRPLALVQADRLLRQVDAEGAMAILSSYTERDSRQDALEMSVFSAVMAGDMPIAMQHCAALQKIDTDAGERALAYVQQFRTLFARREARL